MLLPETVATTFAGADGTPAGVALELAEDCAEVATVVTAATLKVYALPLSKPETTQLLCPVDGEHEPASLPFTSYAVTKYSTPVKAPDPK
jgi:hypothetical protein